MCLPWDSRPGEGQLSLPSCLPAPSPAVPAQGHRGGRLDWEGTSDAGPTAGHADLGPRVGLRLLLHAVSSEGAPVPRTGLGCAPHSAWSERTRADRQTGRREVAGGRQAGCFLWAEQGMASPAGQREVRTGSAPGPATRRPLAPHFRGGKQGYRPVQGHRGHTGSLSSPSPASLEPSPRAARASPRTRPPLPAQAAFWPPPQRPMKTASQADLL